jgi:phosphatidylglycerophosphate synthase
MDAPTLITLLRLASVPALVVFAWYGQGAAFLLLLAADFASDAVDGYLARRLGVSSDRGANLDTLSDLAIYAAIPVCGWWLWPDLMRREALYFLIILASLLAPGTLALLKFHRLTSYHTWLVKLAVFTSGMGVLVLFAGGTEWPFRLAAPVCALAALEQMAITLVLSEPRADVRSVWDVLQRER